VVPIQKFDYFLATQNPKFAQQFGREFVVVAGCDVILNFTGAGPQESAEWALVRWIVHIPLMPLELLDPVKVSLASCAVRFLLGGGFLFGSRFLLGAYTAITVVSGILDRWMFSSSQRLSLEYINVQPESRKA
jgi:hypothetical protein